MRHTVLVRSQIRTRRVERPSPLPDSWFLYLSSWHFFMFPLSIYSFLLAKKRNAGPVVPGLLQRVGGDIDASTAIWQRDKN